MGGPSLAAAEDTPPMAQAMLECDVFRPKPVLLAERFGFLPARSPAMPAAALSPTLSWLICSRISSPIAGKPRILRERPRLVRGFLELCDFKAFSARRPWVCGCPPVWHCLSVSAWSNELVQLAGLLLFELIHLFMQLSALCPLGRLVTLLIQITVWPSPDMFVALRPDLRVELLSHARAALLAQFVTALSSMPTLTLPVKPEPPPQQPVAPSSRHLDEDHVALVPFMGCFQSLLVICWDLPALRHTFWLSARCAAQHLLDFLATWPLLEILRTPPGLPAPISFAASTQALLISEEADSLSVLPAAMRLCDLRLQSKPLYWLVHDDDYTVEMLEALRCPASKAPTVLLLASSQGSPVPSAVTARSRSVASPLEDACSVNAAQAAMEVLAHDNFSPAMAPIATADALAGSPVLTPPSLGPLRRERPVHSKRKRLTPMSTTEFVRFLDGGPPPLRPIMRPCRLQRFL